MYTDKGQTASEMNIFFVVCSKGIQRRKREQRRDERLFSSLFKTDIRKTKGAVLIGVGHIRLHSFVCSR